MNGNILHEKYDLSPPILVHGKAPYVMHGKCNNGFEEVWVCFCDGIRVHWCDVMDDGQILGK